MGLIQRACDDAAPSGLNATEVMGPLCLFSSYNHTVLASQILAMLSSDPVTARSPSGSMRRLGPFRRAPRGAISRAARQGGRSAATIASFAVARLLRRPCGQCKPHGVDRVATFRGQVDSARSERVSISVGFLAGAWPSFVSTATPRCKEQDRGEPKPHEPVDTENQNIAASQLGAAALGDEGLGRFRWLRSVVRERGDRLSASSRTGERNNIPFATRWLACDHVAP